MYISTDDLRYARNTTMAVVCAVYTRFRGQPATVAGVDHLADLHLDLEMINQTLNTTDAKTERLLQAISSAGSIFGAIDRDPATHTAFVAFRGTETTEDWLEDFFFPGVPFEEVPSKPSVHAGFHIAYQHVRRSLFDNLHLINGATRVIVTGHSLGAAVASLCALDLASHPAMAGASISGVECCTFASPRAYRSQTAPFDDVIETSLRVANPVDIVTHLPSIAQGYFHVHGGLYLHAKLEDFHDLNQTYGPGIDRKLAEATSPQIALEDAESIHNVLEF